MIRATLRKVKMWYRAYKMKKQIEQYPEELKKMEEKDEE